MLNLNPFGTNYPELQAAYPRFYLDVLEMQAILKAEGKLLDDITEGIELVVDNNFIVSADEKTITTLERALGITEKDVEGLTLDQRKNALIILISGKHHFGEAEIKYIVSGFIEGTVTVRLVGGAICITVEQGARAYRNVPGCVAKLEALKPAHLRLDLLIRMIAEAQTNFYVGIAMRQRITQTFTTTEPTLVLSTFLEDEDGDVLTDEDGNWMADEADDDEDEEEEEEDE